MSPADLAAFIKTQAAMLGFFDCGIAKAGHLAEDAGRLEDWILKEYHAGMGYMEQNLEKRCDPGLLVEGTRSVIILLYNYFPEKDIFKESRFKISKYAFGKDYHDILRTKTNMLCEEMVKLDSNATARGFTDSAPVLERAWATRAGLGWIGKNSMLITRKHGSYFFLSAILTNLEPEYDEPFGGNYCGDCTRCIDACPTQAIVNPRIVDARQCISFLTIENKGEIPEAFKEKYKNWIFGCDICQDVCPWNRFSTQHNEKDFLPSDELTAMQSDDWPDLDEERFRRLFSKSPIKRCKFSGLKRNISFVNHTGESSCHTSY